MTVIPRGLPNQLADLYERMEELERRLQNKKRTGVVTEVDPQKGLARVQLSETEGKPFVTGWIPWGEIAAGKIKTHIPPSVGQQVKVVSENGDLTDAEIDMSLPSNSNKRPHDKEAEAVIEIEGTRILLTKDEVRIKADKIILDGECHFGGEGGVPCSKQGTKDTGGFADVSNLASKVYIT